MTSSHRKFKDNVYDQFARLTKAFAAPKRLELLDLLCQAPRTVETLADLAAITVANASKHLQVLRSARLVDAEKKGLYVEYYVADDEVWRFVSSIRTLADARLTELRDIVRLYFDHRDSMERHESGDLLKRACAGEITVVDVRPREEYQAGHFPRARSIPLKELESRLRELPRGKKIVAYCRGPYCVMAVEAVELLRRKGFRAFRVEQGVTEWRALGWRVETGPER